MSLRHFNIKYKTKTDIENAVYQLNAISDLCESYFYKVRDEGGVDDLSVGELIADLLKDISQGLLEYSNNFDITKDGKVLRRLS